MTVRVLGMAIEDARVVTRDAARAIDAAATEELGIPSIILMENAAIHLASVVGEAAVARGAPGVLIVAGPGNNGGDGLAAARHLANAGVRVRIIMPLGAPREGSDAATNYDIAQRCGIEIRDIFEDTSGFATHAAHAAGAHPIIIDALLGTGLDRPVTGIAADAVAEMNRLREAGCAIVSADIPSGLDADTGVALGHAVIADVTVTFAALKPALVASRSSVGRVFLAGIGIPGGLADRLGRPVPTHVRLERIEAYPCA